MSIMNTVFKNFFGSFKKHTAKTEDFENQQIISTYHQIKRAVPNYNEPNYLLAEKVFLEFNEFNLKNINEISNVFFLIDIPKSLLPYPKNYIKCAYYVYSDFAEKNGNTELFKVIQEVGFNLFYYYPDYPNYKKKLESREEIYGQGEGSDFEEIRRVLKKGKEDFKKLYGDYEISEENYYNSPNSADSTNERIIHDFGILPEIEEDIVIENVRRTLMTGLQRSQERT